MRRSCAPSALQNGHPSVGKRPPATTAISSSFKSPLLNQPSQRKVRKCAPQPSSANPPACKSLGMSSLKSGPLHHAIDYESLIAQVRHRPFVCPLLDYDADACPAGNRSLGVRRTIVRRALHDPGACNALVLWSPPDDAGAQPNAQKRPVHVVVDPVLGNILRPHQRQGVRFMYDCVTGAASAGDSAHRGCIMADEMGLGKTLQCITLLWTLLRQSAECRPTIIKAIIVCPSSLVKNWYNEFGKWLGTRLNALALENSGPREQTVRLLEQFMANQSSRSGAPVLILSYETFRNYAAILCRSEVGLLLCDEGHRLKNCENLTYTALMGLQTQRRVLLSGTPVQNDLTEYYSLLNFVNPGMLGTRTDFRRQYEQCILRGQDAASTVGERQKAAERMAELAAIVNRCLIRRTNSILTKYLPVKFEMVICVRMTDLQTRLYREFLRSDAIARSVGESDAPATGGASSLKALSNITALKKLCSHPDLVHEKIVARAEGFERALELLPSSYSVKDLRPEYGSKLALLDVMLAGIRTNTTDRIVLVSNYTQTLDLFERLCRKRSYVYVRLDGSMSIRKRAQIVEAFNRPDSEQFVFMLSSKAGGCGLNLIGANRLVMFDPDWNPANDDQAMARVWRDGQTKPCFIYRMLATGTIEEKIFQRQTHKKALSSAVVDNGDAGRHFTRDDLRDLFSIDEQCASDTHAIFKCQRCVNGIQVKLPPTGSDCTSDLTQWFHCANNRGLPDSVLTQAWQTVPVVSFVFHHRSAEVAVEAKRNDKDATEADGQTDEACPSDRNVSEDEGDSDSDDDDDDDDDDDFVV